MNTGATVPAGTHHNPTCRAIHTAVAMTKAHFFSKRLASQLTTGRNTVALARIVARKMGVSASLTLAQ